MVCIIIIIIIIILKPDILTCTRFIAAFVNHSQKKPCLQS